MPNTPTPARPALDAMAEEIERLDKLATPGPLTRSALVMLYAVQDYGDNEPVAAFGEWEDDGDLRMRFQGDKADSNLALYVYLRNNAPALVAALRSLADMRGAIDILGFGTAKDAWLNLFGASEDLSNTNGNDEITKRTVARVLQQLAEVRAALARSAP